MKKKLLSKYFLIILITFVVNVLVSQLNNIRIDFTKEKKYTLSEKSRDILKKIDDKIFFKIYYSGKLFTPELKSFKKEIKQLISELKYYSKYIDYEFIDLYSIKNIENRNKKIYELTQKGIHWSLHPSLKNNYIIWGAEISYKTSYSNTISFLNELDKEWPINCAGKNDNISTCLNENYTNSALKQLEYTLINGINNALDYRKERKKIGILGGHKEKNGTWISSIKNDLESNENYIVEDTILLHQSEEFSKLYELIENEETNHIYNLSDFDCLIINNPNDSIYFLEKVILDQYIMNGGKTVWLIKGTKSDIDSLQKYPEIPIVDLNINIRNMLYKYGVRINSDIVRDYNNSGIKLTEYSTGLLLPFPWDYFPVIKGNTHSSISNNINDLITQFPSSIDTIANGIKKTILLQTSQYSKTSSLFDMISFDNVELMSEKKNYNQSNIILGVLLEGFFESYFKNRIPKEYRESLNFIEKSKSSNNMIVISDGNFITNQIGRSKNSRDLKIDEDGNLFLTPELTKPLALGYDRNNFKKYNNSNFILNCIDYLTEERQENYLFEIRKKQTKINKLDKVLLEEEKEKWQIINSTIPIIYLFFLFIITNARRIIIYKK